MSALHARPGSEAEAWAEGLAWLWRLGAVEPAPGPNAIGVGTESEAAELSRLVQAGELRGAIVAVRTPGDAAGIPARRVSGVASFGPGARVAGEFVLLERSQPAAESSLGVHAAVDSGVLYLGYDPDRDWGRLDSFWAFEAAAAYLRERAVELTLLPPIGALRLDDIPGIALHQLQDRAKPDRRQALRIRRTSTRLRAAGAVLNVAVSAEALEDGARVPLDQGLAPLGRGPARRGRARRLRARLPRAPPPRHRRARARRGRVPRVRQPRRLRGREEAGSRPGLAGAPPRQADDLLRARLDLRRGRRRAGRRPRAGALVSGQPGTGDQRRPAARDADRRAARDPRARLRAAAAAGRGRRAADRRHARGAARFPHGPSEPASQPGAARAAAAEARRDPDHAPAGDPLARRSRVRRCARASRGRPRAEAPG